MIINGDCLIELKKLKKESVDAVVTDPPYELGFMGKKWDASGIAYNVELWKQCLRILKPGGHLLSFGGTRTYHRMACAIEDAGFEIRDMLEWVYNSGFPKSLNIGKAVDKKLGNERQVVGEQKLQGTARRMKGGNYNDFGGEDTADIVNLTKGNSKWEGYGTALKPAHEPIVLARKPLKEKTIVDQVLKTGTGGLNIDGCRIPFENETDSMVGTDEKARGGQESQFGKFSNIKDLDIQMYKDNGRFPANLICSNNALKEEDSRYFSLDAWSKHHGILQVPKSAKSEKNRGCDDLEDVASQLNSGGIGRKCSVEKRLEENGENAPTMKNNHPTVKPISLMQYLIVLVSKPGDTIIDPFAGSGSTLVAAKIENRKFIGIEMTEEYIPIIEARLKLVQTKML